VSCFLANNAAEADGVRRVEEEDRSSVSPAFRSSMVHLNYISMLIDMNRDRDSRIEHYLTQ
jgi:hypothetical protein